MSNDWWARHLGGGQQAPSRPVTAPVAAPQAPWPGSGLQSHPNGWAGPQQPAQGPLQDPNAQMSIGDALQYWQGGEGKRNSAQCPRCGSGHLFRRKTGVTEAAPLCYDCGYNGGLFEQADPANWQ